MSDEWPRVDDWIERPASGIGVRPAVASWLLSVHLGQSGDESTRMIVDGVEPDLPPAPLHDGVSDRPAVHRCAGGAHLRGYQRSDEGDHRQVARLMRAGED